MVDHAANKVAVPCTCALCCTAQDIYSFGIVMWELWTLREPFEGINYHALLHMMSTSQEAVRPPLPGEATPATRGRNCVPAHATGHQFACCQSCSLWRSSLSAL